MTRIFLVFLVLTLHKLDNITIKYVIPLYINDFYSVQRILEIKYNNFLTNYSNHKIITFEINQPSFVSNRDFKQSAVILSLIVSKKLC